MKSVEETMAALPLSLGSQQRRNLNLCFAKLKFPLWSQFHSPSPPPATSAGTPTSTLIKTFNSLYDSTSISKSITPSTSSSSSSILSSDPDPDAAPEPDLSTIHASSRFFFSSPGRSNSIVESLPHAPTQKGATGHKPDRVARGGVAVPTFSPDPYADFRRSMQEMVDARQLFDVKSNWECLHELLLSYLSLNPKSTHKFIMGAFSDLLVTLMSEAGGDHRNHLHRRRSSRQDNPSRGQQNNLSCLGNRLGETQTAIPPAHPKVEIRSNPIHIRNSSGISNI